MRSTGPEHASSGRIAACCIAALGLLSGASALAQNAPRAPIYTCVDASGKKLTSDRPIPECLSRDQRELNGDGSFKRVVPPPPTADELSDQEARERDLEAQRVQRLDAIRRDSNLIKRFPDEAAHRKAREKALDDVRNSVRISQQRIALLNAERKPLLDEAEFYVGKPLPLKLKLALDANDASLGAQNALVQNQTAEVVRINALFDVELARLRKLWAGVPAGTLTAPPPSGASTSPAPASAPPARTVRK